MSRVLSPGVWVTAITSPTFYALLDQGRIMKITSLSAGGGTGTMVFDDTYNGLGDIANMVFLKASSTTALTLFAQYNAAPPGDAFAYSTDSMSSHNTNYYKSPYGIGWLFSYFQIFESDLSNPNLIWTAYEYYYSSPSEALVAYSQDGGANWTEIDLGGFPAGYEMFGIWIAPCHDGDTAYFFAHFRQTALPHHRLLWVYKLTTSGGLVGSYIDSSFESQTFLATTPVIDRGCVRIGDTDHIYTYGWDSPTSRDILRFEWSTTSWSTLQTGFGAPNFLHDIRSLPSGRMYALVREESATINLHFYYTDDDWSTYTDVDLSSMVDSSADLGWEHVARGSDGTLAIALGDGSGSGMYVLFSMDNGTTWQKSGYMPMPAGTEIATVYDFSGNGGI